MFHPRTFQTPNAIDAGEAPPTRPARRMESGDSNSSPMPSDEEVRLKAERLLSIDHRGTSRTGSGAAGGASSAISFRKPRSQAFQNSGGGTHESSVGELTDITDQTFASYATNTQQYQYQRQRQNLYGDDAPDPFDADDRRGEEEESKYEYDYPSVAHGHGSLPSAHDAHLYAATFHRSNRDMSPDSAERTSLSGLPLHNHNGNRNALNVSRSVALLTPAHMQDRQKRRMKRCIWVFLAVTILSVCIAAIVVLAMRQPSASGGAGTATPPPTTTTTTTSTTTNTTTNVLGGTSQRLSDTLDFLTKRSISNRDALDDWTTPQYDAAVWIADHDALKYPVPTSSQRGDQQYLDFVQRYVMALFYYSLNGPAWVGQHLFLESEHLCGWYSTVSLDDGDKVAVGVTCNDDDEVYTLLLPRNTMDGTLPTELAHLTKLDFIDLNRNTIHGSIPDEFAALKSLRFLDLRYNQLTGSIPDWIGTSWTNLVELSLNSNSMTGSLPTTMSSLQKLKTLSLAHNQFGSTLAPIASLTNMEYLYLEQNGFEGDINDDFFKGMSKLVQVDVSTNRLSAQNLPLYLFQHETLQVLDLSDNIIMGTLPTDIVDNTALQYLSLSDNSITGTLPERIDALRALTHLDLTGNGLTGQMPESLSTMSSLTYVFLSENGFNKGPIPDFFAGMGQLRELSLSSTQRNGTLPSDWLGGFENLVLFDVSYNEMTGPIPDNIWNHEKLEYLLLNRNQFQGSLPSGIGSTKLNLLLLDKNSITGDLTEACNLKVDFIVADCDEVICDCCTCCSDSDPGCNDDLLYTNKDFSWDYNYTRVSYAFSPAILFEPPQQSSGLN